MIRLDNVFDEYFTDGHTTIVTGDINIDMSVQIPVYRQLITKNYKDLLVKHRLEQIIQHPTCVKVDSSTLIDHVVAKNGVAISAAVIDVPFSDHKATLCTLT
jgi:hypothetical protein